MFFLSQNRKKVSGLKYFSVTDLLRSYFYPYTKKMFLRVEEYTYISSHTTQINTYGKKIFKKMLKSY